MLDFYSAPSGLLHDLSEPSAISLPHKIDTKSNELHERAVTLARTYQRVESELIDILQEVETSSLYLKRGHSSLFRYVITELGLSENIALTLITVARKSREVPELKKQISCGTLSLSNARRIAPLITPANQREWIAKASELSNRQLEKEIVKILPKEKTIEKASYTSYDRIELKVGLSEKEMLKLRRVQDLLCQSKKRMVTLEETVEHLTSAYLKREDPLEKAKRHHVRRGGLASHPGDHSEISESGLVNISVPVVDLPAQSLGRAPAQSDALTSKHPTNMHPFENEQSNQNSVRDPATIGEKPTNRVNKLVTLRVPALHRIPIAASIRHFVNYRDGRKCVYSLKNGKACGETRWLEIHHRIPVSLGGKNVIENLATLCRAHHRAMHLRGQLS